MFLLIDPVMSGASNSQPLKAEVSPALLRLFPLSDKWKKIEGLFEDVYQRQTFNRKIPGWGRMIDGRHVLVLHDHYKGSPYGSWRLYLNGDIVYSMVEVTNEKAAKDVAEVYMKSDKLRFIVKFEEAMNNILKQYEGRCHDPQN